MSPCKDHDINTLSTVLQNDVVESPMPWHCCSAFKKKKKTCKPLLFSAFIGGTSPSCL